MSSTDSSRASGETTTNTSSDAGSSSSTDSRPVVSLLEWLRAPTTSVLSRKRKIDVNPPPPVGKKRSKDTIGKFDPQSVKPSQRAKEFPGEELVDSAGKLFCRACRESVAVKRSVVQNHIKSKKHADSKERLKLKVSRERDIAEALRAHDAETHRKGETLLDEQNVYRAKVVMTFMRSGIPLSKLDCTDLRNLLEENGYRLTDARHLLDMVPFIVQQERTLLRSEIQGKYISMVFDGTSRLGEVLAVVVRFVDEWNVQQRLVRLEFLQKCVNGEELARELISILSVTLGIESSKLIAVMHDRASVNGAAMRTVKVIYPDAVDIGCISHTLDIVGHKFKVPTLHLFFTLWTSLFTHSPKVKALWKEQTGRAMSSYSNTRWWSRWEVQQQVLQQFGDVELFLARHEDIGPATRTKLLDVLHGPQLIPLKVELAAVVDIGSYFVKGTYNLEGDGILAVKCYEEILKIRNAINAKYYPNLQAVCRDAFPGNLVQQQQLIDYGFSCVQPGLLYFLDKFGTDTIHPVSTFKAARLFSPTIITEVQPTATDINTLNTFPFLSEVIEKLKEELPTYLARASAVASSCSGTLSTAETLEWWKNNSSELPYWSLAAQRVFLLQPSSAAAERVFSILNRFGVTRTTSLEDYVEGTVMLQYNKRKT